MPLQLFQTTNRQYVPEYDLAEVAKTYDTLQARHDQAIAQTSALKTEFANIQLNAAEDGWKQNKLNEIQAALEDNLYEGSAAYALDDVVAKYGDIRSDAGLLGRIRANQEYEQWNKELDASSLSEDYKEYFRKNNPYYYKDKVDDKGNVIGGTSWKPIKQWVNPFDYGAAMTRAIQLTAKEKGGGSQMYYIDAKGNRTTDPAQASNAMYLNEVSGQWEKLDENKIKEMFYGIVESTPGAKAAIRQDYEVATDYYKTTGDDKYGIKGTNGYNLTEQEFVANKINPMASAAAYYNQVSSSTYSEGIGAYLAKHGQTTIATSAVTDYSKLTPNLDSPGYKENPLIYRNQAPIEKTSIKSQAQGIIGQYFPDTDFKNFNTDDFKKKINADNSLDLNTKRTLLNAADAYQDAVSFLSDFVKDVDPRFIPYIDVYNQIESGAAIDTSTTFGKEVSNSVDNFFTDSDYIYAEITDGDLVDKFIANYEGGVSALEALGITITNSSNGGRQIRLNSNNKESFFKWSQFVQEIQAEKPWYDKIGNDFKNYFGAGDKIARVKDGKSTDINIAEVTNSIDRNVVPGSNFIDRPDMDSDLVESFLINNLNMAESAIRFAPRLLAPANFNRMFATTNRLYNDAEKVYNTKLKDSNIFTSVEVVQGPSPRANSMLALYKTTQDEKYKKQYDQEVEDAANNLLNIGLTQYGVYELDESGRYDDIEKVSTSRKMEIQKELPKYDLTKASWSYGYLKGKNTTFLTVPGNKETDYKPLKIAIEGYGNSAYSNAIDNEPNTRAMNDVKRYLDSKVSFRVTNNDSFNGLGIIRVKPINSETTVLEVNGEAIPIGREQVTAITAKYYTWNDTFRNIQIAGNNANPQIIANEIKSIAPIYASITGQNVIDVEQQLIENISPYYDVQRLTQYMK